MNSFRQWVNRDNGRWFQIGNEDLNYLQVIGYGCMLVGFLLLPIREHLFPSIPVWIPTTAWIAFPCFLALGEWKKRRPTRSNKSLERSTGSDER
jgi:hypothetical protein